MKGQSKTASVAESLINIAVGIGVGFVSNVIVLPMYGYAVTLSHAAGMTVIFTVISFARSYMLRRWFNWMHLKEARALTLSGVILLDRWFGLSYARWLTLPRVLMVQMPPLWQGKMAGLLDEFDGIFPKWLPEGQYCEVGLRGAKGRMHKIPDHLCEFRCAGVARAVQEGPSL